MMTAATVALGVAASLCLGTSAGCARTPTVEGDATAAAATTPSTNLAVTVSSVSLAPPATDPSDVGMPPSASGQDCIGDLAAEDVFVDMPRNATIAIVPQVEGTSLGAVLVRTVASGDEMAIETVYDASCTSVSSYRNLSNESAAKGSLHQYEAVEYTLGDRVVSIELAYGEGAPILLIRGYLLR
jgi:hypothetical protein